MNVKVTMLAVMTTFVGTAAMAQDAEQGERVFRKCKACHQLGPDAAHRVGPVLNGIVGRQAGTLEDFSYSRAMEEKAAEGLVWTEEDLDAFLTKPREFMDGTAMAFAGLRKEEDRQNVIAYLATFGAEGEPVE